MSDQKHELVRAGQSDMPDLMTLGKLLVASGYFTDARDQAKAVVKVLAGRELGLPPIAAMTGIHIVEGKPTLGSNLYASFLRKHPLYDYRVKEASRTACEVVFLRGKTKDAEVLGTYRMTLKEATEAGLTHGRSGVKHNWKAHPDAMLFARVISQGTRIYCPDVFDSHTVYTPDELGAGETEALAAPPTKMVEAEVVDDGAEKLEAARAELRELAGQITSEETHGKAAAAIEAAADLEAIERVRARIGRTLQVEAEARATKAAEAIAPETPPAEPAEDRRPADAPAEGADRRAPASSAPASSAAPPSAAGPQPGPARPRAGAPAFGGGGAR